MSHTRPVPHQQLPSSETTHVNRAIAFAFRLYKSTLSPVMHTISPSRCMYLPTCSEYAYTAISRFGIAHGGWLALRRLARCHPWAKGGLDPVPEPTSIYKRNLSRLAESGPDRKASDHLP